MTDRRRLWVSAALGIVVLLLAGSTTGWPAPRMEQTTSTATLFLPLLGREDAGMSAMPAATLTLIYDNYTYDPVLRTNWGLACWVETGEATVLFDTGADSRILLDNMAALGLDPQAIDAVVLSHAHSDHIGGLAGLLDTGARPIVYVPASFPASFKAAVRARTALVEVSGPLEIAPGVHTTGQMGTDIVEQALVVETGTGALMVTGCAHPGIVEMVRRGKDIAGPVAWVMGGFHLGEASQDQIEEIVAAFRELGVKQVAPGHCTGDPARQMFAAAYGTDCALAGVGWVMNVDVDGGFHGPDRPF